MSEKTSAEYYFVDAQGTRNGPINEADFIDEIATGTISPETPVWRSGESNWLPLKAVRNSWFPNSREELAEAPALERLNADISFGSLFSDTWNFLFTGNNFWLLLVGGILWVLIDAAASTVLSRLTPPVVSLISTLVFLIFIRKWDRGETPAFSDLFPLKQFFFLPWCRSLGASILAGIAIFIPGIIAGIIGVLSITAINAANPELGTRLKNVEVACAGVLETLARLEDASELPKVSVETEHEHNDTLPEVEDVELTFPNNATLTEAIRNAPEISESIAEDIEEISEILFASPIFRFFLATLIPLAAISIFLAGRLAFVSYFPLDTEAGVIDSLKYSWRLTSGKFWKILIFCVLLSILFLIGTLITLGLGYIILCPYILVAFPILYAKLIKSRPELNIPSSRL